MKYPDSEKVNSASVQTVDEGYGPIYDRKYIVPLDVDWNQAKLVFDKMKSNLNDFLPNVMATVESTNGCEWRVNEGNRYVIHLLGPWDAPLEVAKVDDTFFEFKTLENAPEAGKIRYLIERDHQGRPQFLIHSTARSGLYLFHIMYHYLQMGKWMQRKMWEQVCINFYKQSESLAGRTGHTNDKKPHVIFTQSIVGRETSAASTPGPVPERPLF